MERRDSNIHLSADLVDRNGLARLSVLGDGQSSSIPTEKDAVASIAPWLDEEDTPPTPPPKPMTMNPQLPPQSSRRFPFSSFVSNSFQLGRSNVGSMSTSTLVPSESRYAESNYSESKYAESSRYADSRYTESRYTESRYGDDESFRNVSISSSSTHSREARRRKSSIVLPKLKSKASKQHMRSDSSDPEHPSLRPPLPPLPTQNSIFNMSTQTLVSTIGSKAKKSFTTKKSSQSKEPPIPPPKDRHQVFPYNEKEGIIDISLEKMHGIVNLDIHRASGGISPVGDIDVMRIGSHRDSQPQFGNPFPPETSDSRPWSSTRKTSYPVPPDSVAPCENDDKDTEDKDGKDDKSKASLSTWQFPPSWHVVEVLKNPPEGDARHGSESSDESEDESQTALGALGDVPSKKGIYTPSEFPSSLSKEARLSIHSNLTYQIRLYLPRGEVHLVDVDFETTVASVTEKLIKRIERKTRENPKRQFEKIDGHSQLYLKESMRERMLGPLEKPASIVKLRLEQAGYTVEDGQHLVGAGELDILLKFVYQDQLGAGTSRIDLDAYESVNLEACSLRAIPPIVHQNAEQIIRLKLSRNPMVEIPLDFIQACTRLADLQITHMYLKQVPESVQHCLSLHSLDISSNAIRDLENTKLTGIRDLFSISAQNNRLSGLPKHFGELPLTKLNISNNKFRTFPIVLTEIKTLQELDISFNMIAELPSEIGLMTAMKTMIIIGNQVQELPAEMINLVNLTTLDIRRNNISDLTLICRLPEIQHVSADHNAVRSIDLALGLKMKSLVVSHNDITHLQLAPGPMGISPYTLTTLDLSYAKLSSIDNLALGRLSALRELKLDHNEIRSVPDSLGDLKWLETFSCTNNKLDLLPSSLGRLQKLETLDAHNNNLNALPQSLWNCASLTNINLTANFIGTWPLPPFPESQGSMSGESSPTSPRAKPSLAFSLEKLYMGGNILSDNALIPLMIFDQLQVLNLSFNDIHDLPPNFFHGMVLLEELYLSGNKLISIPVEDLYLLTELKTLFLNGNKLQTLPQELGYVVSLRVLDVGSNYLKYNIHNKEFDWNWNSNVNLKYLNLSGNKRLQITGPPVTVKPKVTTAEDPDLKTETKVIEKKPPPSNFENLSHLKVLGLMDVTVTTTTSDASDIPDENIDRRVRTSLSTVCGMGYGISDALGQNDHLTMLDLVHEFNESKGQAIFAMFGRTHSPKHLHRGWSPNELTKYLHDKFVPVFKAQLSAVNETQVQKKTPSHLRTDHIPIVLTRTFLKLNQDYCAKLRGNPYPNVTETPSFRTGVAAVAVYLLNKTLYAANVGDALAVVSRQGVCHVISRKHDPFDRLETARIRAAEGSVSPTGLVNSEVKVSRAFGYYHLFPPINARPDTFVYPLTDMDEFIIIANRGLWDFIPYQTAVDYARHVSQTHRHDPMLIAQKLRDFAISFGADGTTMIMVVWVGDLFNNVPSDVNLTYGVVKHIPRIVHDRDLGHLDEEIAPPVGNITLVFTDIRSSTQLWEMNHGMMAAAMRIHNSLLRRQLRFCGGYEVKTEGDAFMCSFPNPLSAVWWCLTIQMQLLYAPWPIEILESEDGKPIYDADGNLIARGLSVRMGIHSGQPLCEHDLITQRMDYFGPMVNRSARIQSSALGGQIACSRDIIEEINTHVRTPTATGGQFRQAVEAIRELDIHTVHVGEVKLKGIELPEILYILYPYALRGRHDLSPTPAPAPAPVPVPSQVKYCVAQIEELGILCLRFEALSTGRRFKLKSDRKQSIMSDTVDLDDHSDDPKVLYCDPKLLLPHISDQSTDEELTGILDSLVLRIVNAVNSLYGQHIPPKPTPPTPQQSLMSKLIQDGTLDAETLRYIATLLERY